MAGFVPADILSIPNFIVPLVGGGNLQWAVIAQFAGRIMTKMIMIFLMILSKNAMDNLRSMIIYIQKWNQ